MPALFASLGWLLVALVVFQISRIGRRPRGLPPGPSTLPLLGNAHQLPRCYAYLRFTEWAREYGGIYSLMIASKPAVIISDPRIARNLMDRKSATTSDRPSNYMVDYITDGKHTALARYSADWRQARSTLHQMLTKEAIIQYEPIQRAEATQLMHDLLVDQNEFFEHIFRYSYSVASAIIAGVRSPQSTNAFLVTFKDTNVKWATILEPGSQPPVDLLPALKYVPERWAKWKTLCREIRATQTKLYGSIVKACERRIERDESNGSMLESLLEDKKLSADKDLLRGTVGAFMEGASDTTAMFLRSLILMLVAFPETQVKARNEIDAVVGSERAPLPSDFQELPYIQAIIKEVLRMRPVLPLGLPHCTTQEEIIDGYLIPKDSTIFMNQYGILHDPDAYDDPDTFNPDRFLQSEYGVKPSADLEGRRNDFHFGGGRRICVGMHVANNSMNWNAMNLLWGFSFNNAIDPVTKEVIPVDINNYSKGISTAPNPFRCDIQVRSAQHAEIIRKEFLHARPIFQAFEYDLADHIAASVDHV